MTTAEHQQHELMRTYAGVAVNQLIGTLMMMNRDNHAAPMSDVADQFLSRVGESIRESITELDPAQTSTQAVSALTLIANRLSPEKA